MTSGESMRAVAFVLSTVICTTVHASEGYTPLPDCRSLPAGEVQYSAESLQTEAGGGGWRLLFDGKSTQGWRSAQSDVVPSAWSVKDGALTVTQLRGQSREGRGDLLTTDQFENFVLRLQWAATPGGNSGIFYLAQVDLADRIWKVSPEMQILDDERSDDGRLPSHRAGGLYDVYAPKCNALRPVGEYNDVRIVVLNGRVEHWLNGYRVVNYQLGTAQWREQVARSKFRDYPQFGAARRGHIALQDHGDEIRFRNIHIRVLPPREPQPPMK